MLASLLASVFTLLPSQVSQAPVTPMTARPVITVIPISYSAGASGNTPITLGSSSGGTLGSTTPGQIGAPGNLGGSIGTPNIFNRFRRWPSPKAPGLYEVRVAGLPTGYLERFILQIPTVPAGPEAPLLIGFHVQNVSMWDLFLSTTFPVEAEARGWYVLAPMAATQTNLSSVPAQRNVELVLGMIAEQYPIDRSRIYGVGFSMGGGTALSYAARHVNPEQPMLAAVVNHTGVCSQRHSYEFDCFHPVGAAACPTQSEYEFWFGGPPATNGFEFAQCSVIDMGLLTAVIDPDTDFARNLLHIPIMGWLATQDPLAELVEQNFRLAIWIFNKGGSYVLNTVVNDEHSWTNLDVVAACNFFAQQTLTLPTQADTLADRDERWFHFDLVQDTAGAFSRFSWSVDTLANELTLLATANVQSLRVDTQSAGLDTTSSLTLTTSAADALGETISFTGYALAPTSITRDGQPFAGWTHDPGSSELVITDSDGSQSHTWVITP